MSRGDRAIVSGNISSSMRDNYGELGVEEYYRRVGTTYRNPHFPGIRLCLFSWLDRWWHMKGCSMNKNDRMVIFDMACGFGEVTQAFREWWKIGSELYRPPCERPGETVILARRKIQVTATLSPDFRPLIVAADPYTAAAYQDRTSLSCAPLSFKDISEGAFPPLTSETPFTNQQPQLESPDDSEPLLSGVEMVVCSFALHLVENPSQLFSLLWELSLKSHWLVVLAPHKKPEIKDGWGWQKWNIHSWESCQMTDNIGELLHDRVHCRVYRSLNVPS